MNMQTEFINNMLDSKIKHFEERMASAKKDVEHHTTMSIIQSSANTISECATALELLGFVKLVVKQSENFCEIMTELNDKDVATTITETCNDILDDMNL